MCPVEKRQLVEETGETSKKMKEDKYAEQELIIQELREVKEELQNLKEQKMKQGQVIQELNDQVKDLLTVKFQLERLVQLLELEK